MVQYKELYKEIWWGVHKAFVTNSLRYVCATNKQNRLTSDKDIAKIKRVTFLWHTVYTENSNN